MLVIPIKQTTMEKKNIGAKLALYSTPAVVVRTVDDNGKANGIGAGGGDRILRTTGSPACLAKCRYPGVPETLPLDFAVFMESLKKGQEHAE